MQLFLGTNSYDIFPSYRVKGTFTVSLNEDRFDLIRMRKVKADRGACVIASVAEAEALAYTKANPIEILGGWARVREIFRHYSFGIRFSLGLTD